MQTVVVEVIYYQRTVDSGAGKILMGGFVVQTMEYNVSVGELKVLE